jgi:hypothetical protein
MIKKVASGDLLRINEKYEKKYETVPFTTFFLSANKLPHTPDTTYAFYRRSVLSLSMQILIKYQGYKEQSSKRIVKRTS